MEVALKKGNVDVVLTMCQYDRLHVIKEMTTLPFSLSVQALKILVLEMNHETQNEKDVLTSYISEALLDDDLTEEDKLVAQQMLSTLKGTDLFT